MQVRSDMVIEDADLAWRKTHVTLMGQGGKEEVDIEFRGGFSPFNPKVEKGMAMLKHLSADIEVEGRVASLAPLKIFFAGTQWIERLDGTGDVAVDLAIQEGRLQESSELRVDADDLLLDFMGFRAQGSGRVEGEILAGDEGREAKVTVLFDEFSYGRQSKGTFALNGENLTGSFKDFDFQIDLDLTTRLSGSNWDDFEVRLKGTEIRLSDGIFRHSEVEQTDGWWMTIDVPVGRANLAMPLDVDAKIDLGMRDTRVLVALFAEIKSWIRHFDGLLTIEDIKGHARAGLAEKHLSLRNLSLEGEGGVRRRVLGEVRIPLPRPRAHRHRDRLEDDQLSRMVRRAAGRKLDHQARRAASAGTRRVRGRRICREWRLGAETLRIQVL